MPNTDSKPTSEKEQTQVPQTYLYAPPYPQQIEDDTINLYELWTTLWNKKWLVIAVTIISALGSVVYALRQPITYRAQALLLPPKAKDVQSLSVREVQEQIMSASNIFAIFKKNLSSRSLQKKFIEKYGLMEILAPNRTPETRDIEILEGFSTMIKVKKIDIGVHEVAYGEGISVSMESHDPDFPAKLINDYISFFDSETISGLVAAVRDLIAHQISAIENSIASKREMEVLRREDQVKALENTISAKREKAKKQREDEIHDLENTVNSERAMAKKQREDKIKLYEEAAVIASKLGFRDGVDTANTVQNNQLNISTTEIPLYNRGYRALRAEIEHFKNRESDDPFISGLRDLQQELANLRSRKSDDPFIFGLRDLQVEVNKLRSIKSDYTYFPGLRSLQEQLALLRAIKIEEDVQHAVTVDQAAYPPKHPIKSNIRQIVTLSTVVGLFLGISLTLFVVFVQKQKEKQKQKENYSA